jgi:hypothetical protein
MKTSSEDGEDIWKRGIKLLCGPCPKDSGKEEECEWCGLIESEDGE